MESTCTSPSRARDLRWCCAMAFPASGTPGVTNWPRSRRPGIGPSHRICAATGARRRHAMPPHTTVAPPSAIWSACWTPWNCAKRCSAGTISGHIWSGTCPLGRRTGSSRLSSCRCLEPAGYRSNQVWVSTTLPRSTSRTWNTFRNPASPSSNWTRSQRRSWPRCSMLSAAPTAIWIAGIIRLG